MNNLNVSVFQLIFIRIMCSSNTMQLYLTLDSLIYIQEGMLNTIAAIGLDVTIKL